MSGAGSQCTTCGGVDDLLDLVLLPAEVAVGRPLESTPSRQAGR